MNALSAKAYVPASGNAGTVGFAGKNLPRKEGYYAVHYCIHGSICSVAQLPICTIRYVNVDMSTADAVQVGEGLEVKYTYMFAERSKAEHDMDDWCGIYALDCRVFAPHTCIARKPLPQATEGSLFFKDYPLHPGVFIVKLHHAKANDKGFYTLAYLNENSDCRLTFFRGSGRAAARTT